MKLTLNQHSNTRLYPFFSETRYMRCCCWVMGVGAIGSCCCLLLCLKNPTRWRGRKWWKTRQDDDCIRRLERNWCVKLTNEKTDYNAQYIRLETHLWVGSRLNSIYTLQQYILFLQQSTVYTGCKLFYMTTVYEAVGRDPLICLKVSSSLFLLRLIKQHA